MALEERAYESPIIDQVALILRAIGPFSKATPRKDKWRTTEQLMYLLRECYATEVELDDLDRLLSNYEALCRERMNRGLPPGASIRRAVYPDRTTALPLWGSTEYHGQPWPKQPQAERTDPPDDLPSELCVPKDSPRVFLSHTHRDAEVAVQLTRALAARKIGAWMFETDIAPTGNIAECVRSAIGCTSCCVALVTRESIASLWVLTELHTALETGKRVALVIDTTDDLLLDLLKSVKFNCPGEMFDRSVEFSADILGRLHADYASRVHATRAERYPSQARDFLATLPGYLHQFTWPAFSFPVVPAAWEGPVGLADVGELIERVLRLSSER